MLEATNNNINKKIYFLEGNMGAGKSTLLASIDKDKYNVLDEPMDLFCSFKKFNPLEMFYKKKLSCFSLSIYIISTFFDILLTKTVNNKINVLCRNPFSTILCFAKLSNKNREMKDIEYEILCNYIKIYEHFLKGAEIKFIYLYVNPEVCFNRIKKRNRKEEKNVSIDYIKDLDQVYNDYIEQLNYPKVIINGSKQDTKNIKENFLKQLL